MRALFTALILLSAYTTAAHSAESIAPGMSLSEAAHTLARNGYQVDSEKFGFQVVGGDESQVLEFCRVDDGVTLVLTCDRKSKHVASLSLFFFGDGPKSTRSFVVREVLKMSFDDDSYTVMLRRQRPGQG